MNSVAKTTALAIPLIERIRTAMWHVPGSVFCWRVIVRLFMPIRLQDRPANATHDFGDDRQLFVRQALLWLRKLADRIGSEGGIRSDAGVSAPAAPDRVPRQHL